MLRSQLVERFAERHNISSERSAKIITIILESIKMSIQAKQRVEIRGFGSFSARPVKARKARNPKTGEPVYAPEKFKIYFRASRELIG